MLKSLLILALCLSSRAWAQPSGTAMPKPDQVPAPPNPGVRQIPPPKTAPMPAPSVTAPAIPISRAPAVTPQSNGQANARAALQRFADGLAILLLNLGAYNDPTGDQKNRIMIALNNLKAVAYEVQPLLTANSKEPVMRYISFDLPKQLLRMEAAIAAGTYSYARYLLRQTTHYTVTYHPSGPGKIPGLLQFPEPPQALSELEKAEYFAAIKRYEDAILSYERVLVDKQFRKNRPDVWEKAVENLMAITIRVRNDARITLEMSSALLEESSYNPTQKEMLQAWRTSAKAWSSEGLHPKTSGADLLSRAQQSIEKGNQLSSKGNGFGTIEYLRAMTLLNELALSEEPDSLKAKGFQLTGKTSEKLRHVFLWMHPDAYYEACVRARPHTAEARECVKLLETFQTQQKDVVADRDKVKQLSELAR